MVVSAGGEYGAGAYVGGLVDHVADEPVCEKALLGFRVGPGAFEAVSQGDVECDGNDGLLR